MFPVVRSSDKKWKNLENTIAKKDQIAQSSSSCVFRLLGSFGLLKTLYLSKIVF